MLKLLIFCVLSPFDQEYVRGGVPPFVVSNTEPSLLLLQVEVALSAIVKIQGGANVWWKPSVKIALVLDKFLITGSPIVLLSQALEPLKCWPEVETTF